MKNGKAYAHSIEKEKIINYSIQFNLIQFNSIIVILLAMNPIMTSALGSV